MKKRAKDRMSKRRARFVVGYITSGNGVYSTGQTWGNEDHPDSHGFMVPMTRTKAKGLLTTMPCADCAIFELVPVEVNR